MATAPTFSESEILADVLAPDRGDLTPDVARTMLRWRFSDVAIKRMNDLAARNREGQLTSEELDQLDRFLRVGSFVNLLQAKARLSLLQSEDAGE
ncbi:MAG: hypothetical protein IT428_26830 [Planctomycetaceae bacterium]|nr:hypothetical protein [Planctomycetaceae bacterium]